MNREFVVNTPSLIHLRETKPNCNIYLTLWCNIVFIVSLPFFFEAPITAFVFTMISSLFSLKRLCIYEDFFTFFFDPSWQRIAQNSAKMSNVFYMRVRVKKDVDGKFDYEKRRISKLSSLVPPLAYLAWLKLSQGGS